MSRLTAHRINRVLDYALNVPWALDDARRGQVARLIVTRARGETPSIDEVEDILAASRTARRHGAETQRYAAVGDGRQSTGPSVAVVSLIGVMQHRADALDESSGVTSMQRFGVAMTEAADDDDVTGIAIDIDSPGGEVGGVEEAAEIVAAAAERKPVIAVANTMAASAAYWVASQATEIVIAPGGEVGSIGVWDMHVDARKALEQDGLEVTVVSAGAHKVERFPYLELSDEARAEMQRGVDDVMDRFAAAVADGRGVTDAVARGDTFGEGRLVADARAVSVGMADRVATLAEVIGELVGQAAEAGDKRRRRRGRSIERARLDMVERGIITEGVSHA